MGEVGWKWGNLECWSPFVSRWYERTYVVLGGCGGEYENCDHDYNIHCKPLLSKALYQHALTYIRHLGKGE